MEAFTSEKAATGEILWTSTRLNAIVGVEENDPSNPGERQFRINTTGTSQLTDLEFYELLVVSGWDLDGSNAKELENARR